MPDRNPKHNSILQALLDLEDRGMGTLTLSQAVSKITNDSKLQNDLQKAWDSRYYADSKITYVQLEIDQAFMTLSAEACKILLFMGAYQSQTGLIQVTIDTICTVTGLKRTSCKEHLHELINSGVLSVKLDKVRHAAPVYQVNPDAIVKGKRRIAKNLDFDKSKCKDYFRTRKIDLVVSPEAVYDGDLCYNRINLKTQEELTSENASPSTNSKPKRTKSKAASQDYEVPGQMSIEECLPGIIPESLEDPSLPFN